MLKHSRNSRILGKVELRPLDPVKGSLGVGGMMSVLSCSELYELSMYGQARRFSEVGWGMASMIWACIDGPVRICIPLFLLGLVGVDGGMDWLGVLVELDANSIFK
jgi:hypothetical protein